MEKVRKSLQPKEGHTAGYTAGTPPHTAHRKEGGAHRTPPYYNGGVPCAVQGTPRGTPHPMLCEDCGKNYADPPSRMCPGCEAYQAHTYG
jgi:hypothetical protein